MEIQFSKADPCLGYLRAVKTNFVDEAMPKPCGDIFTENHVAEPFSTNTEEGVASSVALSFPQVLVNNTKYLCIST